MNNHTDKIDRLLDAIDLVKADHKEQAQDILRGLIREDSNFEDAWLWMAVAVESLDQSAVCLDNVLRVNPGNTQAAGALFRLRENEIIMEKRRDKLRSLRDFAISMLWIITVGLLYAILFSYVI